ncbi:MAG: glycine cleavage system protein GcvH [Bacillota bacterium]
MITPQELLYSKEHEWVKVVGSKAVIGITDYAQNSLGDLVFVELPQVGSQVTAGSFFGVVESVKAASDCYSPVTGTVVAVNEALMESPELINQDPYGKGWIMEVELENGSLPADLMTAEQYANMIKEGGQ